MLVRNNLMVIKFTRVFVVFIVLQGVELKSSWSPVQHEVDSNKGTVVICSKMRLTAEKNLLSKTSAIARSRSFCLIK